MLSVPANLLIRAPLGLVRPMTISAAMMSPIDNRITAIRVKLEICSVLLPPDMNFVRGMASLTVFCF